MISNYNPKIDKSTVNKNKCNALKKELIQFPRFTRIIVYINVGYNINYMYFVYYRRMEHYFL